MEGMELSPQINLRLTHWKGKHRLYRPIIKVEHNYSSTQTIFFHLNSNQGRSLEFIFINPNRLRSVDFERHIQIQICSAPILIFQNQNRQNASDRVQVLDLLQIQVNHRAFTNSEQHILRVWQDAEASLDRGIQVSVAVAGFRI